MWGDLLSGGEGEGVSLGEVPTTHLSNLDFIAFEQFR